MIPSYAIIAVIVSITVSVARAHDEYSERAAKGQETGQEMIDRLIRIEWSRNNVSPTVQTEDWEFLRRSTLDLLGRLPIPEEQEKFLEKPKSERRDQWCDYLTSHVELPSYWAKIWAEAIVGDQNEALPPEALAQVLEKGFTDWKKLASSLLTRPSILYDRLAGTQVENEKRPIEGEQTMLPFTIRTSNAFLGTSLQCSQCHDHFFEPYRQEEFWGLTSLFRRRPDGKPPAKVSFKTPSGDEMSATRTFLGEPVAENATP